MLKERYRKFCLNFFVNIFIFNNGFYEWGYRLVEGVFKF